MRFLKGNADVEALDKCLHPDEMLVDLDGAPSVGMGVVLLMAGEALATAPSLMHRQESRCEGGDVAYGSSCLSVVREKVEKELQRSFL